MIKYPLLAIALAACGGAGNADLETEQPDSGALPCCPAQSAALPDGGACSCTGSCECETGTPLVLDFDNNPVEFTAASGSFALTEEPSATDWVAAATPWLVLDVNHNGRIDDGRELFGSRTRLPDGRVASNGFEALAVLDADADGWLTPKDPAFQSLRLWSDRNQNRVAEPDELATLESHGIEALQLTYGVSPHCDARGNCELERAVFYFRDGQAWRRGSVIDVHLRVRPVAIPDRF